MSLPYLSPNTYRAARPQRTGTGGVAIYVAYSEDPTDAYLLHHIMGHFRGFAEC